MLSEVPEEGGEVIQFRRRTPAEPIDELELSDHGPGDQLATRDGHDVTKTDEPVDAEIVEEVVGPVRRVVRPAVRRVKVASRRVRQHEPTMRTSKWAARNLTYVFAGVVVLAGRWWQAKTNSSYEQAMRAARAAGDWDKLAEWEQRGELARERRHKRRMDMIAVPFKMAKALAVAIPAGALFLLVIGLAFAIHNGDLSTTLDPLIGVADAVGWVAAVVGVAWSIGLFLLPFLLVGGLWHVGRQAQAGPKWLQPVTGPGDAMDGIPDETMIVNALRHTVPALDKAIKGGWRMHYEMPPMPDGKGWRAQLALPPAAPVVKFVNDKVMLAHNLRRFPIEVWPTEPRPAVLDLWVANPGVLSCPVDPWPLLKDLDNARVDYFRGVPGGVTIKGDVVVGRLFEANHVYGGIMGSGKSTLAITMILGAMLDPLVDIDVVVMAENADYEPLAPRLRSLTTGPGEDTVAHCLRLLQDLFAECTLRGEALKEHDERAVTRAIAEKDPRLRPRIVVIDECQNLFIGKFGKDALEAAAKLMSTARKYAITLFFLTPEPSKDALPRKLITIASNKACFAIGDWMGNDAVLGSNSFRAGISAVGLVPKTDEGPGDVGTCMQRGFTAKPGLMRCFYVPQADAHRVTQRALMLRSGQRRRITAASAVEKRDLLVDVGTVIGDRTVRAADIPALLAARFPGQVLYQQMNGKQLRKLLKDDYGVHVPTTDNVHPVSPELIAEGIGRRANEAT